jgi:anthranilate synthase component 1
MSEEAYCDMVEKTKKYIREGDIFQGVVSRRFEADYKGSLINTYRVLRTTNPSPYMYFIGCDDVEIAGTSPETMVRLKDGKLTTFPVAGTRKRGATDEEDNELEVELLADEKECAEHNMLVDLARNDIGRIAEFGSVNVEEYMKIHRFSKVMHIASTVTGQIRKDKDGCDTIGALLPAGTLSGAPKIRACEIIDELEPVARGIYGGAIGYLDFSGNLDVCIAIRTAVKKADKVYVQAGAGIVADSVPANEYMECANKAGAVIDAVKAAWEVNG